MHGTTHIRRRRFCARHAQVHAQAKNHRPVRLSARSHRNTRIYILIYCPPAVNTDSTRSASQQHMHRVKDGRGTLEEPFVCASLSSDYRARVCPYATRIIYVYILMPVETKTKTTTTTTMSGHGSQSLRNMHVEEYEVCTCSIFFVHCTTAQRPACRFGTNTRIIRIQAGRRLHPDTL